MTESTYYHGSADVITAIHSDGLFGGLFATPDRDAALSHGDVLHVVESPRALTDYALNYEIEGAWEIALELADGVESIADDIMSADCGGSGSADPAEASPLGGDWGDYGWEIQRRRGMLAARLGYTSVEIRGEHGATWLCLPGCTIALAPADE